MQNDSADTSSDERRLCRQVNIRMTEGMRADLEKVSRENWTSASQFARLAVAMEIDRHQLVVRDRRLDGLEPEQDES